MACDGIIQTLPHRHWNFPIVLQQRRMETVTLAHCPWSRRQKGIDVGRMNREEVISNLRTF